MAAQDANPVKPTVYGKELSILEYVAPFESADSPDVDLMTETKLRKRIRRRETYIAVVFVVTSFLLSALYLGAHIFYIEATRTPIAAICAGLPYVIAPAHPLLNAYTVETPDGIAIKLWRLLGIFNTSKPVLLMHDLECSSREWFVGLDNESLPWKLWYAGYDVWIGNNRGNYMGSTDRWEWTFEEMADIDLPAIIEAVLMVTNAVSIVYVGHGQGALQGLLHFSENHTTATFVSHFLALAPTVYLQMQQYNWTVLGSIRGDLGALEPLAATLSGSSFREYEKPQSKHCWKHNEAFCNDCSRDLGGSLMQANHTGEEDPLQANHTGETDLRKPAYGATCADKFMCLPAGTSSNNIRTFAEGLRMGGMKAYLADRGRPLRLERLPSHLKLSFVVGSQDSYVQTTDVERVIDECTNNSIKLYSVLEGAGHMDLVWGKDAPTKVYDPFVDWLVAEHGDV